MAATSTPGFLAPLLVVFTIWLIWTALRAAAKRRLPGLWASLGGELIEVELSGGALYARSAGGSATALGARPGTQYPVRLSWAPFGYAIAYPDRMLSGRVSPHMHQLTMAGTIWRRQGIP